jgi:uncharacterized UBP type Zn finger protein
MADQCTHIDRIEEVTPSSTKGCAECMAKGDRWTHLRLCLTCGQVGCCDSSPNKHASKHAAAADHPIATSFEPGETWAWCYVDDVALEVESLHLPHRDPYPHEVHPR